MAWGTSAQVDSSTNFLLLLQTSWPSQAVSLGDSLSSSAVAGRLRSSDFSVLR